MCLENWEVSESNFWQFTLVGSAVRLYAAVITLTTILYAFFAGSGCTLNQFFISFNLVLCVIITHPVVQEANPRSTLLQSGMVAAYCTYLIISAVGNHTHKMCNPLRNGTGSATHNTTVVLGAVFTFLAIAYSTTRAATQSKALIGKKHSGAIQLSGEDGSHEIGPVTVQPSHRDSPRYQSLLTAVEAG